jgi:hypothetical protein
MADQGPDSLKRHFPTSVKFISRSFAELEDDLADRVSAVRRNHEEAEEDAAGHLLLFLAEPLSSQVHVYKKASLVWSYLEEQHNVWLRSRGPVLEDEKLELGPRDDETVGAYCRLAIQL